MAAIPYFILSPNTILSLIGFIRGPDKTVPTPAEDWHKALQNVNVVIPAFNEEKNIIFCLTSLLQQTVKPKRIIIIDDGSTDQTCEFVKTFCEANDLNLTLIHRQASIGKTPTLKRQAREFDGDVEFILDGDTILESPNYIERVVQELYQGVGIASACGLISPLYDKQRKELLLTPPIQKFLQKKPNAAIKPDPTSYLKRLDQEMANLYRDVLYRFLGRFVYMGQMKFFGSITNPVGCAVAYKQKYVKDLFDKYEKDFGDDLTNSEDIFIGFALLQQGYRNIQVNDVCARSCEPRLENLPKQIYLWSSSFIQSCYFLPDLPFTIFKSLAQWRHSREQKLHSKEIQEKRKIKEAYRQTFGDSVTKKYGRPMGWVIFTSIIEKFGFSIFFWLACIMGWWVPLAITLLLEMTVALSILCIISPGERWKYLGKGIVVTPIRYLAVALDIFVLIHFFVEIGIYHIRKWRK